MKYIGKIYGKDIGNYIGKIILEGIYILVVKIIEFRKIKVV